MTKLEKRVMRRTGQPFYIATVEDMKQSMELFISEELHEKYGEYLVADAIILVTGKIYNRANGKSLRVERIIQMKDIPRLLTNDLSIRIPPENDDSDKLKYNLKNLLGSHRGNCPVFLVLSNGTSPGKRILVGKELFVTPDYELFDRIRNLFGENCLVINNAG